MTKFVVTFCVLALLAAFAGTVPAVAHITLYKAAVIGGNQLAAGEYRLQIGDAKVTFSMDRKSIEIPAKIETAQKKFENTEIQFDGANSQNVVKQINLGGTKTFLIFN